MMIFIMIVLALAVAAIFTMSLYIITEMNEE